MKLNMIVLMTRVIVIFSLFMSMGSYAGLKAEWASVPGARQINISLVDPPESLLCQKGSLKKHYFYLTFENFSHSVSYELFYLGNQAGIGQVNCETILKKGLPGTRTITLKPHQNFLRGIFYSESFLSNQDNSMSPAIDWYVLYGDGGQPEKPTPPPPVKCSAQAVEINFGDIAADTVHELRKQKDLRITCSELATVKVRTNSAKVSLRSDLSAYLIVDGSVGTTGIQVQVRKNSEVKVPIIAELDSKGVVPAGGLFEGSAIIYVDVV